MAINRRILLASAASSIVVSSPISAQTSMNRDGVIDDLRGPHPEATNGSRWQLFTDRVMGGVSEASMVRDVVESRAAIRMRGDVRLENNGGFVQIALDLAPDGRNVDASGWRGIEIDVQGNGEEYALHLRTAGLTHPWQSYRQSFKAEPRWQTPRLSFANFTPYRTDAPLDLKTLRRVGVVAIGRAFHADLAVGGLRFFA